jgi:hypothetical protein
VLGHVLELPALASADWRRGARVGGAARRTSALIAAVGLGVVLGFVALTVGAGWL